MSCTNHVITDVRHASLSVQIHSKTVGASVRDSLSVLEPLEQLSHRSLLALGRYTHNIHMLLQATLHSITSYHHLSFSLGAKKDYSSKTPVHLRNILRPQCVCAMSNLLVCICSDIKHRVALVTPLSHELAGITSSAAKL